MRYTEIRSARQNEVARQWSDIAGWDGYLAAEASDGPFGVPTAIGTRGWESVRFRNLVRKHGSRTWFPGCGIDPGPLFYAYVGCTVLATDFSPVAVGVQMRFAELAPEAMATAAGHFFASLRPGGTAVIDTINVQGRARDVLEDSLADTGFFLPFSASERWYRNQLDSTGIVYWMVLGRPQMPNGGQYPAEDFAEYAERGPDILASFRTEYEARRAAEGPSVKAALDRPETIVAHVVYATG